MKFIRKVVLSLLLLIALLPVLMPHPLPQRSKDFSLAAISAEFDFCPEWETKRTQENQEVKGAMEQSYHHLGNGGQCFAFVSEDRKYVIKFFKQKVFQLPLWMEQFPLPFLVDWLFQKKRIKKQALRYKVFLAFKLCFEQAAEETGLLYIHLNKTQHLNKALSFWDDRGKVHHLNLDDLQFVIQKKADLAYSTLALLIQKDDLEGAKLAIDQLLKLNLRLYHKGLLNRDTNFQSNYGFIDTRAIVIDVGRIIPDETIKHPEKFKQDLLRITPKFRLYLSLHHPELVSHFDESLGKIIHSSYELN